MNKAGSTMLVWGAALVTAACGGSTSQFGGDPSGGMPSGGNPGAGGSVVEAGGSSSGAGTAHAGAEVGGTAEGGAAVGGGAVGGGTVDPPAGPRCDFAPEAPAASAPATVSAELLWERVSRFLEDASIAVPPGLPAQVDPAFAEHEAMSILDGHLATKTEAPGLVRFLTAWLHLPRSAGDVKAAHVWSLKLLEKNATLSSLLAEPTGEPHRIGILTDPEVLTALPRITPRGYWMASSLFCTIIPPVPPGLPVTPSPGSGVTRREKYESTLTDPSCHSCHQLMDPAGDSLEHFDAQGKYRELDNGKAVDSSATITSPVMLSFSGIEELAPQLAVSCPVAQCFSKLLMTDAYGAAAADKPRFTDEEANRVANAFADSSFSIRALVKAIVTTPSFLK